ncbi:Nucleotide-binding universal stress protein, UspA family [Paracoccus isoporae]|uniref:Nucleotide-binding universal stress protein, UspA family n=1 Tax=Paracoccus isoporae TaxID=591205 RepID=A0A1G7EMD6_9RHOB|nr:universal stress protein [Paracoccus isoporae]SDE64799.1 Nucleotide-binding universal stress protein, UspA family [Paracoccus isoporae]
MFNTILLPIDLQHPSSWDKALPAARQLVEAGGTLHLLGIVHDVGNAWVASYLPKDYEQRALEEMKASLGDFVSRELGEMAGVTTHVGHGHVAETIIATADRIGADLIVMASHSPDELRTFRISSQADRVVRHSPVSVMIVR